MVPNVTHKSSEFFIAEDFQSQLQLGDGESLSVGPDLSNSTAT